MIKVRVISLNCKLEYWRYLKIRRRASDQNEKKRWNEENLVSNTKDLVNVNRKKRNSQFCNREKWFLCTRVRRQKSEFESEWHAEMGRRSEDIGWRSMILALSIFAGATVVVGYEEHHYLRRRKYIIHFFFKRCVLKCLHLGKKIFVIGEIVFFNSESILLRRKFFGWIIKIK